MAPAGGESRPCRLTARMGRKIGKLGPASGGALGGRQHGVVSAGQLLAARPSDSAIHGGSGAGGCIEFTGVYAVGHRRSAPTGALSWLLSWLSVTGRCSSAPERGCSGLLQERPRGRREVPTAKRRRSGGGARAPFDRWTTRRSPRGTASRSPPRPARSSISPPCCHGSRARARFHEAAICATAPARPASRRGAARAPRGWPECSPQHRSPASTRLAASSRSACRALPSPRPAAARVNRRRGPLRRLPLARASRSSSSSTPGPLHGTRRAFERDRRAMRGPARGRMARAAAAPGADSRGAGAVGGATLRALLAA